MTEKAETAIKPDTANSTMQERMKIIMNDISSEWGRSDLWVRCSAGASSSAWRGNGTAGVDPWVRVCATSNLHEGAGS